MMKRRYEIFSLWRRKLFEPSSNLINTFFSTLQSYKTRISRHLMESLVLPDNIPRSGNTLVPTSPIRTSNARGGGKIEEFHGRLSFYNPNFFFSTLLTAQ